MISANVSTVGKKKNTTGQAEALVRVFHSMYAVEIAVSSVHTAGKQKTVRMSARYAVLRLTMTGATILVTVSDARLNVIIRMYAKIQKNVSARNAEM